MKVDGEEGRLGERGTEPRLLSKKDELPGQLTEHSFWNERRLWTRACMSYHCSVSHISDNLNVGLKCFE